MAKRNSSVLWSVEQMLDYREMQTARRNIGLDLESAYSTSGNSLEFVDSISADANGVITFTTKKVTISNAYNSTSSTPISGQGVASALSALSVTSSVNDGNYIKSITQTNGKVSITQSAMDTTPTSNSKNPVTSGGVYSAIALLSDTKNTVGTGVYTYENDYDPAIVYIPFTVSKSSPHQQSYESYKYSSSSTTYNLLSAYYDPMYAYWGLRVNNKLVALFNTPNASLRKNGQLLTVVDDATEMIAPYVQNCGNSSTPIYFNNGVPTTCNPISAGDNVSISTSDNKITISSYPNTRFDLYTEYDGRWYYNTKVKDSVILGDGFGYKDIGTSGTSYWGSPTITNCIAIEAPSITYAFTTCNSSSNSSYMYEVWNPHRLGNYDYCELCRNGKYTPGSTSYIATSTAYSSTNVHICGIPPYHWGLFWFHIKGTTTDGSTLGANTSSHFQFSINDDDDYESAYVGNDKSLYECNWMWDPFSNERTNTMNVCQVSFMCYNPSNRMKYINFYNAGPSSVTYTIYKQMILFKTPEYGGVNTP